MAILKILTFPDDRLRLTSETITDFTEDGLQALVDDLVDTMNAGPACVGIAAPQVGRPIRLLVMDCTNLRKPPPDHHGLLIACNPVILQWSGMEVAREGCLSLPDYTGNVVRAIDTTVKFQDRTGQGQTVMLTHFEARVMQHEMDHLEGRLFTDRMVSRKADLFKRKVRAKPVPNRNKTTQSQSTPAKTGSR